MRHYPEFRPDTPRLTRLFELQRQHDVQSLLHDPGGETDELRPDIALRLRERAVRSLRVEVPHDQPRKPVATTNFSELSERDAGGLTLATFVKRCLRSF